jgi:hypothetical protein
MPGWGDEPLQAVVIPFFFRARGGVFGAGSDTL